MRENYDGRTKNEEQTKISLDSLKVTVKSRGKNLKKRRSFCMSCSRARSVTVSFIFLCLYLFLSLSRSLAFVLSLWLPLSRILSFSLTSHHFRLVALYQFAHLSPSAHTTRFIPPTPSSKFASYSPSLFDDIPFFTDKYGAFSH